MKIGIIGLGFVGGTTYEVLKEYFEIIAYDKYKQEYKDNFGLLSECEVIFLSVPTPMAESGEIDLSIIKEVLDELNKLVFEKKPIIVIRSTAVPGTTDSLVSKYNFDFVYNPEFLREKHALEDFRSMNRVVMGSNSESSLEKVKEIYMKFLPDASYFLTDFKTAEMIKYASNSTLASQIIIANELFKICENLGIEYDQVRKVLMLDERIGRNMKVPGHDGDFGFGGKCFPKDLNALIQKSKKEGYAPKFLEEVWKSNLRLRKNYDWEGISGAVSGNNNFEENP